MTTARMAADIVVIVGVDASQQAELAFDCKYTVSAKIFFVYFVLKIMFSALRVRF